MTVTAEQRFLSIGEASRLAETPKWRKDRPRPDHQRQGERRWMDRDPRDQMRDFWDDANCAGMDPEMFFVTRSENRDWYDAAKAACRSCPIRAKCLDYALKTPEQHGIWGGLDTYERMKNRHELRAAIAAGRWPLTS